MFECYYEGGGALVCFEYNCMEVRSIAVGYTSGSGDVVGLLIRASLGGCTPYSGSILGLV